MNRIIQLGIDLDENPRNHFQGVADAGPFLHLECNFRSHVFGVEHLGIHVGVAAATTVAEIDDRDVFGLNADGMGDQRLADGRGVAAEYAVPLYVRDKVARKMHEQS